MHEITHAQAWLCEARSYERFHTQTAVSALLQTHCVFSTVSLTRNTVHVVTRCRTNPLPHDLAHVAAQSHTHSSIHELVHTRRRLPRSSFPRKRFRSQLAYTRSPLHELVRKRTRSRAGSPGQGFTPQRCPDRARRWAPSHPEGTPESAHSNCDPADPPALRRCRMRFRSPAPVVP
jgi:hypothetical protein